MNAVTIAQPVAPLQSVVSSQNLKCKGDHAGSVMLSVSGGTGNCTYHWSNGSTSQNLNNLTAGIYHVTVTDANNCSTKNTAEIIEPLESLIVDHTTNNVSCYGMNNGGISLIISGGDPAYQVLWSTGATTSDINGLVPGIYIATVTDNNGCAITTSVDLQQPIDALTLSATATSSNCLTGLASTINTSTLGGTPPYIYQWSNGNNTATVSQVFNGTFTVTITDNNGCSATKTVTIDNQASLNVTPSGPPEICVGEMITLSAPLFPGVQYQWNYNNIPLNGANANSFSTPAAGTYTLTASNNCGTYTSNPIQVTTRTLQNISVSNNFIICPGEHAQLVAGGGLEYSWSPTIGLNNAEIYNPVASPTVTTNYTVTIKDDIGCKATATVQVAVMCDSLNVPNGFSPNGDGTNDYFVIEGLSKYPENTLFIYNRWGNLVYKKQEYDNKWDGKSNVSGIYLGRTLPNGTYYYILDLKTDDKPLNGFVVIRR